MDPQAPGCTAGHTFDAGLLTAALHETLNELLPSTPQFTQKSDVSLAALSMSRLLKAEGAERCEDPLVEARMKLSRSSWKSITPKRFERQSGYVDSSVTSIVGYQVYSPTTPSHPGKRQASSPPPEELDRQLEMRDKFESPRMARRAMRSYFNNRTRHAPPNSEIYQANALALEQSPISPKGWQGSDAIRWERDRIRSLLSKRSPMLMEVLAGFTRIPYSSSGQPPTRVVDREGRLFIYRSKRSPWQEELLPELATLVQRFAERTAASKDERANNNRGSHNFCIAGEDRQSKEKPKASSWHSIGNNSAELDALFSSHPMQRISECASGLLREHFPRIAARMENGQASIGRKYDLSPGRFGLFHNFCINSPVFEEGRYDVFCDPHTDAKNAAILVCVVFVYYYGNCETTADERIWLVFWEAGVIMQVPAGVFVIYPSALLLHFNVHIEDVLVVTKDGSPPTRENTIPFCASNSQTGGRGSMVWFTQASMLISAELPTDSIKQADQLNQEARATGSAVINTSFDAAGALKDGFFPYDVAPVPTPTTL